MLYFVIVAIEYLMRGATINLLFFAYCEFVFIIFAILHLFRRMIIIMAFLFFCSFHVGLLNMFIFKESVYYTHSNNRNGDCMLDFSDSFMMFDVLVYPGKT